MNNWYVYIVECSDSTLYTGITDNVKARILAHNTGKGAKYTKGRGPVILRYTEVLMNRSEATKREMEIKKMTRKKKLNLVTKPSQDFNTKIELPKL